MKKLLFLFIILSFFISNYGQDVGSNVFIYKNSAQIEAGGHGMFYSLNYERILINRDQFKTTSHAGISFYPRQTGVRHVWIPIVVNELFSISKHHLELGVGHVFIREASRDVENNPIEWFWSGRIVLRAGFTPFLDYVDRIYEFIPSGGISVGYCF